MRHLSAVTAGPHDRTLEARGRVLAAALLACLMLVALAPSAADAAESIGASTSLPSPVAVGQPNLKGHVTVE